MTERPPRRPDSTYISDELRRRDTRAHNDLDAIELDLLDNHATDARSGDGERAGSLSLSRNTHSRIPRRIARHPSELSVLERFWKKHVHIAVGHRASLDHLALERTYLSYLRTSLAFANFGVAVGQLFRLQVGPSSPKLDSFYAAGKPLAAIFICAGILICLKGAWRFYRQQSAMAYRNTVIASGWELFAITILTAAVVLALFCVIVAVDIKNDVVG